MTEEQFRQGRAARWAAFADALAKPRGKKFANQWGRSFPAEHRRICRDLNQARALQLSPSLVEDLNRLATEGHHVVYRRSRSTGFGWLALLVDEFPRELRRSWKLFVLAHVLFYGMAVAAGFYVQSSEKAEALLGGATIEQYLSMYNPGSDHFLRPRGVTGDADMFGFYIDNNISIGLRTFASGVLAGVGSLFFLVFNGVALGAAGGVVIQAGYGITFLPFVLGHGAFELTAILIFSVAGVRLGFALLRPGTLSRVESVRRRGLAVLPLVAGATVFLFLAACLEAFWSAQPLEPVWKYSVAGVLWTLVYGFLLLGGRHGRS